jgi:hypothetical protein
MLYLIEDYMSPELLHLYAELHTGGGYFIRYPNNPKLHLVVITKLKFSVIHEFGVAEVGRKLLLHLFGPED